MLREGFGIYQCWHCYKLLNSRNTTQQKRCSGCGSRNLIRIQPEMNGVLTCPRCNEKQLQLYECGLWD